MAMHELSPRPVVHLELHTDDLFQATSFYACLCGWRARRIRTPFGPYLALDLGTQVGGGVVECPTARPLWIPYVEVARVAEVTERARDLGAQILLEPREGPEGWRSVVTAPAAGEIAFWQPKR
jgi:hypothetical protein